ncbi:MAG TPA: 1-deoxy-D-xylulose-5-phosphate reductoisomerase [Candidatus Limnocylindrales bacterium]|nr:1-deoxy-D-xylulose-5-phosphate reductoisomerase [Candidatus Limnocylindrales bacterium]
MKTVTLLGSTGSIGTNTLDVVRRTPHLYRVYGLAAGRNVELLADQIVEFRPRMVVAATSEGVARLYECLESRGFPRADWPELLTGDPALVQVATASEVDCVISAIVGVSGLRATYEAVRRGKRVGLANKEVLVSGGKLVMDAVRECGAELVPVDSEHNGAHQCLRAGNREAVARLILTASGGPFRNTPREKLADVTPEQALNHPTWRMGNRITIDSATLMNKGFEVIEACWLFDFPPAQVDVVIHPQSSVHAMIEYNDGSVLAQISATDMRMPIQYALTYPDRLEAPVPKVDWNQARTWEFQPPDLDKFPLLRLAYQCQETGGSATCTLNAADEIAVEAFLQGRIGFLQIAEVVRETLEKVPFRTPRTIDDVLETDRVSRAAARELVAARAGAVTA